MPSVQVASPPVTHDLCPCVQLFVHVSEHLALGALPEHACGAAHGIVDETNGHESVSTAHVATFWPSWQTVPAPVQTDAVQVQAAAPADTVHAWCDPHAFVVTQAVHPLVCFWQVWTAPETHWVTPAVHPFVQHVALPAAPVHAPFVHGAVDDWKLHPWGSCEQVPRLEVLAHVGPSPAQTGSCLQVHFAEPAAPVQAWWASQATGVLYA